MSGGGIAGILMIFLLVIVLLQEPKRNKPKTPIKISFFMTILFVLTFY